ncbi:MAG TPA: potassium transporter Kup [Acidimicrobiales bacterium]|nr:potassium transporter Kup [Acidimicrobiales bacterium]
MSEESQSTEASRDRRRHRGTAALALGALGIVYGDIGTSPLYAFREAFQGHDLEVTDDGVLGACSLTFWALVVVISIKYLVLVMRADNKGEGGILALTSLLPRSRTTRVSALFVSLGIFGTALLYGDGMITPAISVLSAVEGVEVATHTLEDWIIPIAVAILAGLFLIQRRGTAGIAKVFGPIMLLWFTVLGVLGVAQIAQTPEVLKAVNPLFAVDFFAEYHWSGFWALGSIFLVVTGGEALYADMGHFGRRPIQLGWFSFVFPALVLNYFGQGALLLRHPEHISQPFFLLGPRWSIWPLVILATSATIIASQALISGAFSLTTQAMQLDYLPRVAVTHTSASQIGQVYVPIVNWILMFSCIGLVIGFQSSSNLAAAYGIAVTTTMAITTILFMGVAMGNWGWSKAKTFTIGVPLLMVDLAFFFAQLVKIPHGGWFALGVGVSQFTLMTTWRTGRRILAAAIRRGQTPINDFVRGLRGRDVQRVPGTAVFLFKDAGGTPPALLVNLEHNKVLHKTVLLVSILTEDVPNVPLDERADVTEIGPNMWQVVLSFGYLDQPNVPEALAAISDPALTIDMTDLRYFLGRETVIVAPLPGMASWREKLFVMQMRTAASAARFFHLPADRVFEVGTTVEI